MNGSRAHQLFNALKCRRALLPNYLRARWARPQSVEAVVDLCDDLLADIDALLSITLEGVVRHRPWHNLADDVLTLKSQVYGEMIVYCDLRAPGLAAVLRRSMLQDLADSADRIRQASRPMLRVAC